MLKERNLCLQLPSHHLTISPRTVPRLRLSQAHYQFTPWFTVHLMACRQEERMPQPSGSRKDGDSEPQRLSMREATTAAWRSVCGLPWGTGCEAERPRSAPSCGIWVPCAFPAGKNVAFELRRRNMLSLSSERQLSPLWSHWLLFGKLLATPSTHRQPVEGDFCSTSQGLVLLDTVI